MVEIDPEKTTTEVESCQICGTFRWHEEIVEGIKTTGGTFLEIHHLSYDPEIKIPLCETCHWRVHNEDGFYDHLKPEQTRMNWEMKKPKKPTFFGLRKYLNDCGVYDDDDNVIRVLMKAPDPYKAVQEVALMFAGMIGLEEVHDALYGGIIE
jgi:hypothetical protein